MISENWLSLLAFSLRCSTYSRIPPYSLWPPLPLSKSQAISQVHHCTRGIEMTIRMQNSNGDSCRPPLPPIRAPPVHLTTSQNSQPWRDSRVKCDNVAHDEPPYPLRRKGGNPIFCGHSPPHPQDLILKPRHRRPPRHASLLL